MNTKKSATLKINVERTIESYRNHSLLGEKKVLGPVPKFNWPSFLSKIFIGSTHLEFQKEAEEKWGLYSQLLSRILEMNTICLMMYSTENSAAAFRDAILGNEMDEELTGRAAELQYAEKCEFIRRNLTEDNIDGEPTIKAFMEKRAAVLIQELETICAFSGLENKNNCIMQLFHIANRRFNLLALRDEHYGICPLDRFCMNYEQKNSISSSDNIYSLEELYTLEKDGKLLLDEALEETFITIYRDFSSKNFFQTVEEMESVEISPEIMKQIRSIRHHREAIVCEQEFVYQMLYIGRDRAVFGRNGKILDGILDVTKSNPIGADIFKKSVDPAIISLVIADDKEELKEQLNNKRIEIERNLDRTQNMLKFMPHSTKKANEMYMMIELYQLTIASIDEALNLFNDYSGLDLVQKKAVWAKIESYSRNLQVVINDFDFLRKYMIRYEEKAKARLSGKSSNNDKTKDNVESNRPFNQGSSHLNNNAAPIIQQETTTEIVDADPANPEDIDLQNPELMKSLQIMLCLFLSLFAVSSSMAIYEEI
ncbi:uncharacterized protein NEMAJ01_0710 [Nematocida major]|uniref:uncharacterized protein n=1 Tax=Nematocida major TaxID=1912982 RepID=UPI002007CC94|nr:uncharacterized protein NEMAJ01_0710 [Nematocida major]KAH9385814.1 hypothetical protein NEMAJ01_0710 [Nematocida major]